MNMEHQRGDVRRDRSPTSKGFLSLRIIAEHKDHLTAFFFPPSLLSLARRPCDSPNGAPEVFKNSKLILSRLVNYRDLWQARRETFSRAFGLLPA